MNEEIIKKCYSFSDICRYKRWPINGTYLRKAKKLALKYDVSHFSQRQHPRKWIREVKLCPICSSEFETQIGHPRKKSTCSRSCANTYFRSGTNNPNWKDKGGSNYRKIALQHYPPICNRCGWNKIPDVLQCHHIDRNRSNNDLTNLEILCPTCHQVDHFQAKDGAWASS